jgi:hypothetical protein
MDYHTACYQHYGFIREGYLGFGNRGRQTRKWRWKTPSFLDPSVYNPNGIVIMASWGLGSATVVYPCNETDGTAISYNQLQRIRDTFDTRVISILLAALRSPTFNINIGSLKSASDTARLNTINSLVTLYQRRRAAAPVQRNRIQYYNDDSDDENRW